MRRKASSLALLVLPALWALPAAAGGNYEGWGVRGGLADSPDQVVVGAHWVFEEIAPNLRFMPNIELGDGDDHTILALAAPFHYMFRNADTAFTPYAGGGVVLAWIDEDRPPPFGDDDDFEIAIRGTGGLEWQLKKRRRFFVEVSLIGGDVHDVQAMAGWTFRGKP